MPTCMNMSIFEFHFPMIYGCLGHGFTITNHITLVFQVVFDYDDLVKIPYFRSEIESLTDEAMQLRYLVWCGFSFILTKSWNIHFFCHSFHLLISMHIHYYISLIHLKSRSDAGGEVANQPVHMPLILPKVPGRFYYYFGFELKFQHLKFDCFTDTHTKR